MRRRQPKTGEVGQTYCESLCARIGLHANPSSSCDATGWDVLIEFPDNLLTELTGVDGLHEAATQCLVQVKTSRKSKKHDDVKLTNLHRLATCLMPTFFLFVEIDGAGTVVDSHLVPVDHELITSILRRIRTHEVGPPDRRRLNKRKMRIKARRAMALRPNDPAAFEQALRDHVGPSHADYVKAKRLHLETTGFEDGRAKLTLRSAPGTNNPTLSDLMLGRPGRIELEYFSSTLTRFGIDDPKPEFECEGGQLDLPGIIPGRGEIAFQVSPLSAPIRSEASVFHTIFGPEVDDEHHRVRLAGAFFEHEFNPYRPGPSAMTLTLDRRMPLRELDKAARIMELLGAHPGTADLNVRLGPNVPDLTVRLSVESPVQIPDGIRAPIEQAVRLADRFGLDGNSEVLFGDLVRYHDELAMLDSVVFGPEKVVRASFPSGTTPPPPVPGRNVAVVGLCPAPIGRTLCVAVMVFAGEMTVDETGELSVTSATCEVVKTLVLDRANIEWRLLEEEMRQVGRPHEDGHDDVMLLLNESDPRPLVA